MQSHVASILAGGARSWLLWTASFAFLIIAQQFIFQGSAVMASILAGAITGVFETLLMYPIENLKTQQQLFVAAAASSVATAQAPLKQVVTILEDGTATDERNAEADGGSRANSSHGGSSGNSKGVQNASLTTLMTLGASPSLLAVLRRTLAVHGVSGLYRGMAPTLFCAVPNQALRWAAFDTSCSLLGCKDSIFAVCVAGMITGAAVSLITGVPVETIKTLSIHASMGRITRDDSDMESSATVSPVPFAGPRHPNHPPAPLVVTTSSGSNTCGTNCSGGATTVVNSHTLSAAAVGRPQRATPAPPGGGGRGVVPDTVVMGVLPTILKKVGNQGVRFPVHRLVMDLMCASTAAAITAGTLTLAPGAASHGVCGPKGTGGPMASFIAGVAAGTASIFATQPIDVIKTRMQSIGAERYGHTWQCGARLLREEGIGVFLNGLGARALRSGLGAGFSFAFYPFVKAAIVVAPHVVSKV